MKRITTIGLFIISLSCVNSTPAQQKNTKSPLKEFKGLQIKTDDAQGPSQNGDDQRFTLHLDKSESAQLSTTLGAIETSGPAAHAGKVLFVSSKDGTLLFSTAVPNPSDLPEVVPYRGELPSARKHTHLVYVDPKALPLLQDRGCGPGSACGNGGGGNPSPPPKPIVNPCGPGSQCGSWGGNPPPAPGPGVNPCGPGSACGQGGNSSGSGPKPKLSQDKNPCDSTTTGEKTPKDAKPCPPNAAASSRSPRIDFTA